MTFRPIFMCAGLSSLLAACAASDAEIADAAFQAHSIRVDGSTALANGNLEVAQESFREAEQAFDPESSAYLDGKLYVDHAAFVGDQAMLELRKGNALAAKEEFERSAKVLETGLRDHRTVLQERADIKQTGVMLAGIGVMGALTILGIENAPEMTSQAEIDTFSAELGESLTAIAELTDGAMTDIQSAHEMTGVDSEVDSIERNRFRSALISTDPIAESIVHFGNADHFWCSAFYISPRIIATSGHCIEGKEADAPFFVSTKSPSDRDAFLDASSYTPVRVLEWLTSYDDDGPRSHDFALGVTESPSPHWLTVTSENPGERTGMLIGFSGDLDRGYFKRIDYGCRFTSSAGGIHRSNCTSAGGNSGGPMFVDMGAEAEPRFQVVGIHAASGDAVAQSRSKTYTSEIQNRLTADKLHVMVTQLIDDLGQLRDRHDSPDVIAEAADLIARLETSDPAADAESVAVTADQSAAL